MRFRTKAACENLMDAQINTQRREVAIQSLQCYNYTSFFLLNQHKGGSYLTPCSHPLSPLPSPPLTAQIGKLALISPKSCGSTTSASHPAIIVSAAVGGLRNKGGFAAYRKGFVEILGSGGGFKGT